MTHYKQLMNPDYIGAYALEPGKDLILTIKSVEKESVTGTDGKKEDCIVAHFKEDVKPMILNSTNCKTITKVTGSPYIENWVNKRIQLYATPVKAFGEVVETLRIRPVAPAETKKKLPQNRFEKMIESIKAGTYSAADALEKFELTPEQIKQIQSI